MALSHLHRQCNCRSSLLLDRAIELIEPSPFSEITDRVDDPVANSLDNLVNDGVGEKENPNQNIFEPTDAFQHSSDANGAFNEQKGGAKSATSTNVTAVAIKKVRFSNTCVHQKAVSVHDVMEAYDLLTHAVSLLTSSMKEKTTQFTVIDSDWMTLQQIADTYRALLITSCLLLELLPSYSSEKELAHSNGADNSQSLIESSQNHEIYPKNGCLHSRQNYSSTVPLLSSAIKKKILSTSRRCILSLQSLERICASKSIAQRHNKATYSDTTISEVSGNLHKDIHDQIFQSTSFYSGGDDIIDYDRSLSDLQSDYDWHDDGFLPPPRHRNIKCRPGGTENKSYNYLFAKYAKKASILRECCYRPQIYEGPPSSRYEKSAQTRDWIRGERIVSLRLKDYHYHEVFEPLPSDRVSDFELFNNRVDAMEGVEEDKVYAQHDDLGKEKLAGEGIGTTNATGDAEIRLTGVKADVDGKMTMSNADCHHIDHDDSECDDGHDCQDNDAESNLFFNLSPAVLEEEECNLWDIMFPGNSTSEQHSNNLNNENAVLSNLQQDHGKRSHNKQKNRKNRQRKRRRRMDHRNALATSQSSESLSQTRNEEILTYNQQNDDIHEVSATPHAKEGFLLLIHDHEPAYNQNSETQARTDGKGNENCKHTRVYVRLHPSGWLSIEDRSTRFSGYCAICPSIGNHDVSTCNQKHLSHRIRYWDYFVEANTTSTPCMPKGTELFRFHLKGVRFLGASSLDQCYGQREDEGNNESEEGNRSTESLSNLVFSVDDATGGAFIDGYEWVVALSGAASEAKSLQDRILAEWEEYAKS